MFGAMPSLDSFQELIFKYNVSYIINLTNEHDQYSFNTCHIHQKGQVYIYCNYNNMTGYKTINHFNLPIEDSKVPTTTEDKVWFYSLLVRLTKLIQEKTINENNCLYIHCKGGHGRSGVLVACLLMMLKVAENPQQALDMTKKAHSTRKMKQKWKDIGSPQTNIQKNFVRKFQSVIRFHKHQQKHPNEFDILRPTYYQELVFPGQGSFYSANGAFYMLSNLEFSQTDYSNPEKVKELLYKINKQKFTWYPHNMVLLSTMNRPLYYINRYDTLQGVEYNTITNQLSGKNLMGQVLMDIRTEFINFFENQLKTK
eukprot:Pgem_evm4s16871